MQSKRKNRNRLIEMCVFAMLASLMFCSQLLMRFLPNIHFIGVFTIVFTLVFRKKALIPIYIYVLFVGIYEGITVWWMPYLYVWTILWGVTMLLPKNMPERIATVVYSTVCMLHGLLFGTLCSPPFMIMNGFNFKQTLFWIIEGIPFDLLHMCGNLVAGLTVIPLYKALKKITKDII